VPWFSTVTASGQPRGRLKETAVVPLVLIGATVLGACLLFGYSSFVVGFVLMTDHVHYRH
jgi:hypothetical protein